LRFIERREPGHGKLRRRLRHLGGRNPLFFDGVSQHLVVNVPRHRSVVNGKRFQRVLHAIVRRALPNVLDQVIVVNLVRHSGITRFQFEADFAVQHVLHVPDALPRPSVQEFRPRRQFEAQFVADHDPRLLGRHGAVKGKVHELLARQRLFPPHRDGFFRQRLFHLLVVVGFHFDERRLNVLVVKAVFVGAERRLDVGVGIVVVVIVVAIPRALQIGVPRTVLPRLPQVFERRLLLGRYFARRELERRDGLFDEPGQEAAVLDERVPLRQFPVHVFEGGYGFDADAAEQDDDAAAAGGDKAEDERVFAGAIVTLKDRVSEG